MPRFFRFALLPIALLLTAANAPDAVIAQRGEVKITAGEIEKLLDMMEPAARERLRTNPAALTEAIRERLLRDSLLAEAQAAKWDARADVAEDMTAREIAEAQRQARAWLMMTQRRAA